MNIFRTFWRSARELFDEMFILFVSNLLWLLLNLPWLLLVAVAAASGSPLLMALILPLGAFSLGPANAGMYSIAQRITEGRTSSWRDFIAGMREHARLSIKLYGLWLIGFALIFFNLEFYVLSSSQLSLIAVIIFIYVLLVWLSLLIYIGPLMLLQTDKSLRTIARNAALMAFGRPIFTFGTLLFMGVITAASIWLLLLILVVTIAFLGLWSFRATLTLIAEAEARRERLEARANDAPAVKGRGGQVRPRD